LFAGSTTCVPSSVIAILGLLFSPSPVVVHQTWIPGLATSTTAALLSASTLMLSNNPFSCTYQASPIFFSRLSKHQKNLQGCISSSLPASQMRWRGRYSGVDSLHQVPVYWLHSLRPFFGNCNPRPALFSESCCSRISLVLCLGALSLNLDCF